jgi:hypothetical protein
VLPPDQKDNVEKVIRFLKNLVAETGRVLS